MNDTWGAGGLAMPLTQLIYISKPFGYDDLTLTGILASARRNNERDHITGSLICREDLFMQLLEGPQGLVEAAFDRIRRDDRHANVVQVSVEASPERLFPDWAMRHDPLRSWMWSREQVSNGVLERVTAGEVRAVFERLAQEDDGIGQSNTPPSRGCPHRPG
jgi:hypothetical protein